MDIGNRLRSVREEKNLSQGDIEQRTGLLAPAKCITLVSTVTIASRFAMIAAVSPQLFISGTCSKG